MIRAGFFYAATTLALAGGAHAQDVAPAPATSAAAPAPEATTPAGPIDPSQLGVRFDCLHDFNLDKGAAQACFTITGLRYTFQQVLSPKLRGSLRLDPFATVVSSRSETPARGNLPLVRDTDFVMVDDYALIWSPRPNLEVAFESYGGSAHVPSVSKLALANSLVDTGWKQTALTVTYNLATFRDMRVKFAAGNGEGENGRNLDPQQYFGFEVGASIVKGLRANIGVSVDGNSIGSDQDTYLLNKLKEDCNYTPDVDRSRLGYSTQRIAAGLALDGTMPGAEGLEVGLGWQRNVFSDLDKMRASYPGMVELQSCKTLDPDSVFVEENPNAGVNTVQRTTYAISAAYRILQSYFISADYTSRKLDTGSVELFQTCDGFTGTQCVAPSSNAFNNLTQTAYTFGGGIDLAEGLTLTLEYSTTDIDRKYAQVYYADQNGKTSDTQEYFNARVAYNWR